MEDVTGMLVDTLCIGDCRSKEAIGILASTLSVGDCHMENVTRMLVDTLYKKIFEYWQVHYL